VDGKGRYLREGKVSIKALCRSFGVSRQSLRPAVDKADQAAMEALTPKSPGRKGKSKEQVEVEAMKQKSEIATTFVDIHKKLLNGEELSEKGQKSKRPGKKKRLKCLGNPRSTQRAVVDRTGAEVEQNGDG
jgi:transposase-like protein